MASITKTLKIARHWFWIAPLVVGLVFIGAGIYMAAQGRDAHNDVRDTVLQEDITVSGDAEAFGGQVIDSADKAQAQEDAILHHTLTATGGYLYAQMGRLRLPEGNYVLPAGTYMAASGTGTTTNINDAATDDNGDPIIMTTDASLAAVDSSGNPIRGWTNNSELAAKTASGAPEANSLRDTALTSAQLRTSLGVAVMGFKVSDLVTGLGAFLVVVGVMQILFLAPAVYYAAELANEREGLAQQQAEAAKGVQQPQV